MIMNSISNTPSKANVTRVITSLLNDNLKESYRKVWVQHTGSRKKTTVMFTIFDSDNYQIESLDLKPAILEWSPNSSDPDTQKVINIYNIVQKHLQEYITPLDEREIIKYLNSI